MAFYNFHTHSQYSYKDALPTPKMIAQKYKDMGLDAFCITDHGNLNSFIDAYNVAKELDMQFIPGCEFYLQPLDENWVFNKANNKDVQVDENRLVKYHHITVIAKNQDGLKSLVELYNDAEEHYGKRLVTLQDILSKQGLIVLSGCVAGQTIYYIMTNAMDKAQYVVEQCKNALDDDFYIELQYHNLQEFGKNWGTNEVDVYNKLIELAKQYQIKMVVTNDSHYVDKDDRAHHNLYKAIHLGKSYDYDTSSLPQAYDGESYHILSEEEIRQALTHYQLTEQDIDEIIANTEEIRNKCEQTEFMRGKPLSNAEEQLTELVKQGWEKLRKDTPRAEESEKRWQYEMSVIKEKNFTEYFVNVYSIVNRARELGLTVGPGRGCFLPGNMVSMHNPYTDNDGLMQEIEKIHIGQKVLTHDGEYHKVLNVLEYDVQDEDCIEVHLSNGHTITCTADHKIFKQDIGYVPANELAQGDILSGVYRQKDKQYNFVTITDIKHINYTGKVYDLSVEGVHNYTVGRVTVHNSGAGSEVNYLLGITSVDPLKYGLIFERFLNPSRNGYPDIDVDFQHFVPDKEN